MSYLRLAIAPSTRKTYDIGVAAFRRWRIEHGKQPDELPTTNELGGWLADMADIGGHSASTLRVYTAAISTWFLETRHPDSLTPNPVSDPNIARILKGIAREESRRIEQRPLDDTPAKPSDLLLPTLLKFHFGDSPRDGCFKAAACLAVGGGLRPGELLGSATQPERALRREQLTFFSDTAGAQRIHPSSNPTTQPCLLQLTLRVTKTSQIAATTKMITAPTVVAAVWRWVCMTADRHPRDLLFQLDGRAPLITVTLVRDMERRHAAAGLGDVVYSGKSWRRGGAGTLSALGYDEGDIAALGWAANSHMWERYASDPQVRRQRAIMRGGMMEPVRPRDVPATADRH